MKRLTLSTVVLFTACGGDFSPPSSIEGVRVLAVSSDKPYAAPGAEVRFELLALDGAKGRRSEGQVPRSLDAVFIDGCTNPKGDLFYECYPKLTADLASAFPGGQATLEDAANLPPFLSRGTTASVRIPADALTSHQPAAPGAPLSGRTFVFFAVCAGTLSYESGARDVGVPLRCRDRTTGAALGADDFVFGYSPVFVFDGVKNELPRVDGMTVEGASVGSETCKAQSDCSAGRRCTTGGVCAPVLPRCDADKEADCPSYRVAPVVSAAASEADPIASAFDAAPRREVVFTKLYATEGRFVRGAAVLYDLTGQSAPEPFGKYTAWRATRGEVRLFGVVYDSRGGVAWKSFDVVVE